MGVVGGASATSRKRAFKNRTPDALQLHKGIIIRFRSFTAKLGLAWQKWIASPQLIYTNNNPWISLSLSLSTSQQRPHSNLHVQIKRIQGDQVRQRWQWSTDRATLPALCVRHESLAASLLLLLLLPPPVLSSQTNQNLITRSENSSYEMHFWNRCRVSLRWRLRLRFATVDCEREVYQYHCAHARPATRNKEEKSKWV